MVSYLIGLAALGVHLSHGFQSAFQTMGLEHIKYTPFIKQLGMVYSIAVPLGFAIMPLYIYFIL
jgi:succinate dehydrogenase / fumarate reductase cytochrome b subunit